MFERRLVRQVAVNGVAVAEALAVAAHRLGQVVERVVGEVDPERCGGPGPGCRLGVPMPTDTEFLPPKNVVEALNAIQHEHGWLEPAALKAYAERTSTPMYRLHGVASEVAAGLRVRVISLSLTHTAELAMAHVILED